MRLERSYEVRRATRLTEASGSLRAWPADLALVDALIIPPEGRVALGMPTLVLAGGEAESEAAARWVAKDAESASLIAAVERLLTRTTEAVAGPLLLALIGVLVLIFAALVLYLIWTAVV